MTPRFPLGPLTDLARSRTDDAAQRLGELQQAKASATQQLDLLLEYRRDYGQQLQSQMRGGMRAAQWRNYQQFLGTLDGGIEQQRAASTQAEVRLDHGRIDWQHHKQRLNAFETLAERLQRQERLAQARREQRESDEHAARKSGARTSPDVTPHRELP